MKETAQHWYCPRCHVAISTDLILPTPPTHRCQKAANQIKPLQLQEQETK